jgi:hypothetical protein
MELPISTNEQKVIEDAFRAGHNIKIIALAGAGKSTSLLKCAQIAKENNNYVTLFTYNRTLCDELNIKNKQYGLDSHCKIYTYHSGAGKAYFGDQSQGTIRNDEDFERITKTMELQPSSFDQSNIFMIDEAQDLVPHCNNFLTKLINRRPNRQIIMVGDPFQNIYHFMGTDVNCFLDCESRFVTGRCWIQLNLNISFRLTPANATFINKHILNSTAIMAGNLTVPNKKPTYYINAFNWSDLLKEKITEYGYENVAILCPSVSSAIKNETSPLYKILNKCPDIIAHIPSEQKGDQKLCSKNKLLISTFCSMKGLEKDCIFLLNFDESYFRFFDKTWTLSSLPNIIYVACTRARKELIIIQNKREAPFRTIKLDQIHDDCKVIGDLKVSKIRTHHNITINKNITDLLKFRRASDLVELRNLITLTPLVNYQNNPPPIYNIELNGRYFDVRQYYNNVIPIVIELKKYGQSHTLIKLLHHFLVNIVHKENLKKEELKETDLSYSKYMAQICDLLQNGVQDKDIIQETIYNEIVQIIITPFTIVNLMKLVIFLKAYEFPFIKTSFTTWTWIDQDYIDRSATIILSTIDQNSSKCGTYNVNIKTTVQDPRYQWLLKYHDQGAVFKIPNKEFIPEIPHEIILKGPQETLIQCPELQPLEIICSGTINYKDDRLWLFRNTSLSEDFLQLASYLCLTDQSEGILYDITSGSLTTVILPTEHHTTFKKILFSNLWSNSMINSKSSLESPTCPQESLSDSIAPIESMKNSRVKGARISGIRIVEKVEPRIDKVAIPVKESKTKISGVRFQHKRS